MGTNVERIAEVIAAHGYGNSFPCSDGEWRVQCGCGAVVPDGRLAVGRDHAKHVAEQIAAAGFGHVSTALHQAADEVRDHAWQPGDGHKLTEGKQSVYMAGANDAHTVIALMLRARADRAGGEA